MMHIMDETLMKKRMLLLFIPLVLAFVTLSLPAKASPEAYYTLTLSKSQICLGKTVTATASTDNDVVHYIEIQWWCGGSLIYSDSETFIPSQVKTFSVTRELWLYGAWTVKAQFVFLPFVEWADPKIVHVVSPPSLTFTITTRGQAGTLTLTYYEDGTQKTRSWTADSGDNYPDHEYIGCMGPIPHGTWPVNYQGDREDHPTWWPINMGQTLGASACGRWGFYIHGPGDTTGCIAVSGFTNFSDTLKASWDACNVSSISLAVSYPDTAYTYDPKPVCGKLDAFEVEDTVSFSLEPGQKGKKEITLKNIDPSLEITGITVEKKEGDPSWITISTPQQPWTMDAQSEVKCTINVAPEKKGCYTATFTFEGKIGPYADCTATTSVKADTQVLVAVPEFPLGGAMEIALATVIICVWWKRRQKSFSKTSIFENVTQRRIRAHPQHAQTIQIVQKPLKNSYADFK